MKKELFHIQNLFKDVDIRILFICIAFLCVLSFSFLVPKIQGDSISYLETMKFLKTGQGSLWPNRMITTFGSMVTVMFFWMIFHSLSFSWLFVSTLFGIIATITFYKIIKLLQGDGKAALFSALFFVGNYAMLRFGFNFLMDIGGWMFYILSIFYTLQYALFQKRSFLLWASFFTGIGGLFKEYAFLSVIPIIVFLIFENRPSLFGFIKKAFLPGLLASLPVFILYIFCYKALGYTYLDWLKTNNELYSYPSRIAEYVKSFGSLLNFLGILFLCGAYALWREWQTISPRVKIYLLSIFLSCLPVFLWPAITQRILFNTIPFVVIISSFFIQKKKYHYMVILTLLLYLIFNFLLDSVILPLINLPF